MGETNDLERYDSEDEDSEGVEYRIAELESRLEQVEGRGPSQRAGVIYQVGVTLGAILSWHQNHAVLWATIHGLLSWLYVIYYVIVNWAQVKLL